MTAAQEPLESRPATRSEGHPRRVGLVRRVVGVVGLALVAYGVARLFLVVAWTDLLLLLLWMAAAVAIHDGLLSPLVLAAGRATRRVPARARAFVQGGLVAGAVVTVVALPLIHLEGTQPAPKALLLQDYGANLAVLLVAVAFAALVLYAVRVARARGTRRARPAPPGPE